MVFNCDYNGLAIIQSLGRKGIDIYALDSRRSIGTFSKFSKYIKVPNPLTNEKDFIDKLIDIKKDLSGKPLLMPTNDHWVEVISKNKEKLENIYTLNCSNFDTVSLLLDKEKFAKWAADHAIITPEIWSKEEAIEKKTSLQYPIAVKANSRRKASQNEASLEWAENADKLRYVPCDTFSELEKTLQYAEKKDVPVFCQQVIAGRSNAMHTIGVYANNGTVHGILYGRKNKGYPADFGDCVVGEANTVPEWAETMVVKVCKLLSYTGIAEFEVMEDSKTQKLYLIEINPRSWSWNGVSAAAGVNLALLAYNDLALGKPPQACQKSCVDSVPVIYTKILDDIQNSLLWYRFNAPKDWVKTPRQLYYQYKGKKIVYAEFSRDDKPIIFFSIVFSVSHFLRKSKAIIIKLLNR